MTGKSNDLPLKENDIMAVVELEAIMLGPDRPAMRPHLGLSLQLFI